MAFWSIAAPVIGSVLSGIFGGGDKKQAPPSAPAQLGNDPTYTSTLALLGKIRRLAKRRGYPLPPGDPGEDITSPSRWDVNGGSGGYPLG